MEPLKAAFTDATAVPAEQANKLQQIVVIVMKKG
jgi:hypothetical protein